MGWIKTLQLWKINPYTWFYAYLPTCAENNSAASRDVASFLPWEMTEKQYEIFLFTLFWLAEYLQEIRCKSLKD